MGSEECVRNGDPKQCQNSVESCRTTVLRRAVVNVSWGVGVFFRHPAVAILALLHNAVAAEPAGFEVLEALG